MRKPPGKHTVEVNFEAKWGVTSNLVCHEDAGDDERPCWAHTEAGEPYAYDDGVKAGCMYTEWFENTDGLETLGGDTVTVKFALGDAEWDGDGFTFVLGDLQAGG